jgi:hypothetical protein
MWQKMKSQTIEIEILARRLSFFFLIAWNQRSCRVLVQVKNISDHKNELAFLGFF